MFFLPEEEKTHLQESWRALRGYIRKWCGYQAHPFRRANGTEDGYSLSRVLCLEEMIFRDEVRLLHFLSRLGFLKEQISRPGQKNIGGWKEKG
jgi:hypothetical protein